MKTMFLILTLLTVFISAAPAHERTNIFVTDRSLQDMASELSADDLNHKVGSNDSELGELTLVFDSEDFSQQPVAIAFSEYLEVEVDSIENVWEPQEANYLVSSQKIKSCAKQQIVANLSQKNASPLNDILISSKCD